MVKALAREPPCAAGLRLLQRNIAAARGRFSGEAAGMIAGGRPSGIPVA
jgi:hypothetical protein